MLLLEDMNANLKSTDSTFIDIGIGTQPSFEIVGGPTRYNL